MLKKLLIVYVFIFSYAGAVMHSIVPHHHHDTHKEAKEHHHHDHHASHSHDDGKNDKDNEHKSSLYFLTHAVNADIFVDHAPIDGSIKNNKTEKIITVYTAFHSFTLTSAQQVFHPLWDDLNTHSTAYLFRALRAPPTSLS
jgi:hypothetical protein